MRSLKRRSPLMNAAVAMARSSSVVKFERAHQHLNQAKAVVSEFLARKSYEVVPDYETHADRLAFVITLTDEPDETLSLVLGDAIHNARSALDHLVYELSTLRETNPIRTAFPVFSEEANWNATTRKGKTNVNSGEYQTRLTGKAQAFIKALQPFNGLDWKAGDYNTHNRRKLLRLHQLDITDKHMRLNLAVANMEHSPIGHSGDADSFPGFEFVYQGPLQLDTPTEFIRLTGIPDVEVEPMPMLNVTFAEGGARPIPVITHIETLLGVTRHILATVHDLGQQEMI